MAVNEVNELLLVVDSALDEHHSGGRTCLVPVSPSTTKCTVCRETVTLAELIGRNRLHSDGLPN
jgi:hypothetical protein